MPPRLARSLEHRDGAAEDLGNRDLRELELHAAGLDLGEVEDVVDQREQMPSGLEHVVDVGELAFVELAEHLLVQHLAEADDRVQRRAQLVRHRGQEVGLVAARRLELAVQPLELVAHPVHLRGEAADLVAVRDVEAPREVACGDLVEALLGAAQRRDDRPGEKEAEREREQRGFPRPTPIRRLRELANELRLAATSAFARARVSRASARDLRREGGRESVGAPKGRLDDR